MIKFITLFLFLSLPKFSYSVAISTSSNLPNYVSLLPDIHGFDRFSDGGPDGNWYIGFNNAWIVKLPSAPIGNFTHAFIGAKIGRAKTQPNPDKPWQRDVIKGKIYMAVSQVPAFSSEQSYFLTETSDISIDPDSPESKNPRGKGRWFWAEVPVGMISFNQPNYLIIWSPTEYFTSVSSCPILAAAMPENASSSQEALAWNNHDISGVPPRSVEGALETPINIFPALAIKLVGPGAQSAVTVQDFSVFKGTAHSVVRFSASGKDIAGVWVESSDDQLNWERMSPIHQSPPFYFSFDNSLLKSGNYLRGVAEDESGNIGFSMPAIIP